MVCSWLPCWNLYKFQLSAHIATVHVSIPSIVPPQVVDEYNEVVPAESLATGSSFILVYNPTVTVATHVARKTANKKKKKECSPHFMSWAFYTLVTMPRNGKHDICSDDVTAPEDHGFKDILPSMMMQNKSKMDDMDNEPVCFITILHPSCF